MNTTPQVFGKFTSRLFEILTTRRTGEAWEEPQPQSRPLILFLSCVALYVFVMFVLQPSTLNGEMYAEMGTNYFPNARSPSWYHRLFATDYGYIPLLPRLVALLGYELGLSAKMTPHFYTGMGILLRSLLVGVFCLTPFRRVIQSDILRFLLCLAVLGVADFESMGFLNFAYFEVFPIVMFAILALIDPTQRPSGWFWLIPPLMLSKPAALAVLPLLFLLVWVGSPTFRRIALLAILVAFLQLIQLMASRYVIQPEFFKPVTQQDVGVLKKLLHGMTYSLGTLGSYSGGPTLWKLSRWIPEKGAPEPHSLVLGVLLLLGFVFLLVKRGWCRFNLLIWSGLSLMAFNVLINCFAFGVGGWMGGERSMGAHPPGILRWDLVGFFGIVITLAGLSLAVETLVREYALRHHARKDWRPPFYVRSTGIFAIWLLCSGWAISAMRSVVQEPPAFLNNYGQWQNMADLIDSGQDACIPTNPMNWTYIQGRCVVVLGGLPLFPSFVPVPLENGRYKLTLTPPPREGKFNLWGLAVAIKKEGSNPAFAGVKARAQMKNGGSKLLTDGGRLLPEGETLLTLRSQEEIPLEEVQSVEVTLEIPVQVGLPQGTTQPEVVWWGIPRP